MQNPLDELLYNPFQYMQYPAEFLAYQKQKNPSSYLRTDEARCTKDFSIKDSFNGSLQPETGGGIDENPQKRIKPDDGSRSDFSLCDKSSETSRQKRNRLSAKKFRLRKKEYIKKLEAEIERLNYEIAGYRNQLDYYKNKEKQKYCPELNSKNVTIEDFKLEEIKGSRSKAIHILEDYQVISNLIIETIAS